ncbi:hypothetical protein NJB1507_04100 [Mycobacterium marinum]|nr:hypothetical protein NJB1507_04100 [Mycobacterium marinum]
MVAPELVAAAANDYAKIGVLLGEAHAAAAASTVELLPAAADEVSAGIAHLFSEHAEDYQKGGQPGGGVSRSVCRAGERQRRWVCQRGGRQRRLVARFVR